MIKKLGRGALAWAIALTVTAPIVVSAQSQTNDNKDARREYKRVRREEAKRQRQQFRTLEQNYWRNASGFGIGPAYVNGFYDQSGRYMMLSSEDGYYDSIGYFHPWGSIGHN